MFLLELTKRKKQKTNKPALNINIMNNNLRILSLIALLFLVIPFANAQYANKKVKSKHQQYTDSLKTIEYDRILPIWGAGTYKKGFDIPYPMGAMVNYIWMDQGLLFENFQLGIKSDNQDIPLTPADSLIGFGESRNKSYAVNFRPDIWVFPFLNVYGLFGTGKSTTDVNTIVFPYAADSSQIKFNSSVEQRITTTGIGLMGAFGVGPIWLSFDGNWTWNKGELLDKAVRVGVFGIRVGHTFVFKNHPDRNIALWAGGMRVRMASSTRGEIQMKDAFSQDVWDRKDAIVGEVNTWWDDLSPIEQKLPKNIIVKELSDRLDARDGSSIIRYGMDKKVLQEWNGIIGAQYQFNKNWMLRTEWGLIGDRKSALVSLNYRFLGPRKKEFR